MLISNRLREHLRQAHGWTETDLLDPDPAGTHSYAHQTQVHSYDHDHDAEELAGLVILDFTGVVDDVPGMPDFL